MTGTEAEAIKRVLDLAGDAVKPLGENGTVVLSMDVLKLMIANGWYLGRQAGIVLHANEIERNRRLDIQEGMEKTA